ncbi:glutathione S-transferase [Gymnopus androsaceus JB14]|uniref:Glutathione S-transferase n=1 Tax=Gymnopus androsaceus JB14 TaxID=1447944 RepID=A0A6A4GKX7_9AGAR|nr:glutathione S-transferase [Gymnopus androsaceus JB14]
MTLTQSIAMLDMLETHFPSPALLPAVNRPKERARVLEMAALVACEIQPPQSTRIRKKIKSDFGGDGNRWARDIYERGVDVFEELVKRGREDAGAGRYSVGDEVTWADVFLVPAVQGGLRVGLELDKYPLVDGIVKECWKLEAFRMGGVGEHGRLIP